MSVCLCLNVCLSVCLPVCLSVCRQPHSEVLAGDSERAKHHGTEGRKRRLASKLHCLTLPSEPTRNQLQSAAPMPSKQLHSDLPAGGCETAKHHGTDARKRRLATRLQCLTLLLSRQETLSVCLSACVCLSVSQCLSVCLPACLSVCLSTAPQRSSSGRFRKSKTPWY